MIEIVPTTDKHSLCQSCKSDTDLHDVKIRPSKDANAFVVTLCNTCRRTVTVDLKGGVE